MELYLITNLSKYLNHKSSKLGREVKHSAVVMALRRTSGKFKRSGTQPVFSYSIEKIKTDICYIVLEESPTLLSKIENLYSIIDFKRRGILNIVQDNYEIAIII